jgi:aspartokinase
LERCLTRIKRYYDYVELTPSLDVARFLIPDGSYFKKNEEEIKNLVNTSSVSYEFGAVALIGDSMQEAVDVAATAFGAIKGKNITVYGGDLAGPSLISRPMSRLMIIVKNENVENCIKIIYDEIKK